MAYWLDDGFDTWPETIRVGTAACGLYVRCATWIARNTYDGIIPAEVATMYGTTEWIRKLLDAGLWEAEVNGYRDVKYFQMGNPTAEQVRVRRKAEADRKARWRAKRDALRAQRSVHAGQDAGQTRDSHRDTTRDGRSPLPFPPPKGGEGDARAAPLGAPRVPEHPDRSPPYGEEDPRFVAAEQARLVDLASGRERLLAEAGERKRNGAAMARSLLAAKAAERAPTGVIRAVAAVPTTEETP